jgi:hypothetical protein
MAESFAEFGFATARGRQRENAPRPYIRGWRWRSVKGPRAEGFEGVQTAQVSELAGTPVKLEEAAFF